MIEVRGDMWKIPCHWICVPTNGIYKIQGGVPIAVMGAGVAKDAKLKFPDTQYQLGEKLQKYGNVVQVIMKVTRETLIPKVDPEINWQPPFVVVSLIAFPTKNHYKDKSDLKLIEQSCQQLLKKYNVTLMDSQFAVDRKPYIPKIVLPKVGTGCGGLKWEVVKPVLEKYFESDDFIIANP